MNGYRTLVAAGVAALGIAAEVSATGLPGEYLLSNRWRALASRHSPLNNPAFLTDADYLTVRGALSGGPRNASSLWEIGAVIPVGLYQSVGLTTVAENGGVLQGGRLVNNGGEWEFEDAPVSRRNNNYFVMASWAVNPLSRLSLGINLNGAYQSAFGDPVHGLGIDAGIAWRLMLHPFWGYHAAGLMYQNLLPPRLSAGGEDPDAAQIKASLVSTIAQGRLESVLEGRIADFSAPLESFIGGNRLVEWDVSWTVGVWLLRLVTVYGLAGFDAQGVQYASWGTGLNVPAANGGRDLAVTYQFRSETKSDLGVSHTLYLQMQLGSHREETYARRIGQHLAVEPNHLYNRALQLYWSGRYWDALMVFSELQSRFPDFFKMDWVNYYRASCFERLDMRRKAHELYSATVAGFPKSTVVPAALLGAMRVDYRDGNFSAVFTRYIDLNKPGIPDSIKFHGHYYLGQSLMHEGQDREAIRVLEAIPPHHPEFLYARHSMAVAWLRSGDEVHAEEILRECLTVPVATHDKGGLEMIARSYVLIGYLFYEQQLLPRAVLAFRMVTRGSMYYPDALLGLGWAAIAVQQWGDLLSAGRNLQAAAHDDALKMEGMLFEGAALLAQKDHTGAENVLVKAAALGRGATIRGADSLALRSESAQTDRVSYRYLADDLDDISLTSTLSTSQPILDSMRTVQQQIKGRLDGFRLYQDRYERSRFMSRSLKETAADVDFLLATVKKLTSHRKTLQAQGSLIDQQRKLDNEIERLEQEMQQYRDHDTEE